MFSYIYVLIVEREGFAAPELCSLCSLEDRTDTHLLQ